MLIYSARYFHRNRYALTSPVNLELSTGGTYQWRATSGDPQLTVPNASELANLWVKLEVSIKSESITASPFVVYEDCGNGFTEDLAHYLLPDSKGNISFVWKTSANLIALRIDPVAQAIDFSLTDFSLTRMSKQRVVIRSIRLMLSEYPGSLKSKSAAALRFFRARGLKATLQKVVTTSSQLAQNPALRSANSDEELALHRTSHPERLDVLERYVQSGFLRSTSKVTWQSKFVPKAPDAINTNALPLKLIAFYLPQFHPFAENDAWWGKGFTEWTNVTKTQPQYVGHHQPRLPGELGFYDLRLPEIMRQQIDLAHHYGVTGFCFHHYWFGGKRLMERPVNQLLADASLKMDFCLCWANENWTRRWDGADQDVLIAQNHSPEDDIAFFMDILPALRDPRYIKIEGKPLLIVYRVGLLPDVAATAERWRNLARVAGLPGIYLVAARTMDPISDPQSFGFDATVEFPPHQIPATEITHKKVIINPSFSGKIYDYPDFAIKYAQVEETSFTHFKTVMPSWDNEARKPNKGFIFDGAKPNIYAQWLSSAAHTTLKNKASERLLFVNAWNEWAEGAHLEPDRYYGYAYLHATANVLRNLIEPTAKNDVLLANSSFVRKHNSVIVLHLYYEDLVPSIFANYLNALQNECDLIVTVRPDISISCINDIKTQFPNVYFLIERNEGRDIRPFISALRVVKNLGFTYICKLHTKKSLHRSDGSTWRDQLFTKLIGSVAGFESVINRFEADPTLGLIVERECMTDLANIPVHIDNREWLDILLSRLGCRDLIGNYKVMFPAGSMYWSRIDAIEKLLDVTVFNQSEFELEAGQLDGTLAHAIERIIGLLVQKSGFTAETI
jgi:lipopolysaccharide biosynthesis protein